MIVKNKQLNDLRADILEISRGAFKKAIDYYGMDALCAFALYSDAGAMTVLPSINTKSHLMDMIKSDPDEWCYYKWSTAEWELEAIYQESFSGIAKQLRNTLEDIDTEADFDEFREALFNICLDVLLTLKHEGLFGENLVLFSVSDDLDDERDIGWVRMLNSKELASEFESWINDQ